MHLSLLPFLVSTLVPAPASNAAGPAALPAEINLLAAVPSDALAALHVPNPRALMAMRDTSRWVAFATDAEWEPVIAGLLRAVDEEPAQVEVSAWRDRLLSAMGDSTGLVVFASGTPTDSAPAPTVGLVVRGGKESSKLLRRFISDQAQPKTLAGGEEVLLAAADRAGLYYESDDVMLLLSSETPEAALSTAEECLRSAAAGETSPLFELPGVAPLRPSAPAMEFVADTRPFFEALRTEQPEMAEDQTWFINSFSSIGWVYSSVEIGIGEQVDWNLYAPYAKDSVIGSALGFFGEADRSLFALAPKEALSATVASFDVRGFSAWALEEVNRFSEDLHAQAVAGLSGVKSAIGVDLMDDVFGNMSGQFLGFSSAPRAGYSGTMSLLGASDPTTLVALVENEDPFLDLVESLLSLSGMADAVTDQSREIGDEGAEVEIWETTEEVGLSAAVAVGDGRILLSTDAAMRAVYLDLTDPPSSAESILDDPKRKKAVAAASGSAITIQPTAGFADLIDGMAEWYDVFVRADFIPIQDPDQAPASLRPYGKMATAAGRLSDLIRQSFEGTMTSEIRFSGSLIRIRTIAR